jgi:hypothetical protein
MTLAQLKRTFELGFVCLCTHNAKGPCSFPRRVEKVQTNAIAMSGPDYGAKLGWLHWPKAGELIISELPNGVELTFRHSPAIIRYEWLPPQH